MIRLASKCPQINAQIGHQCCLVALSMDGAVLGTAALKSESVGSDFGLDPWLAALVVGDEHRGKGVGSAVVDAIEARRLGFESIYTSAGASGRRMDLIGHRT